MPVKLSLSTFPSNFLTNKRFIGDNLNVRIVSARGDHLEKSSPCFPLLMRSLCRNPTAFGAFEKIRGKSWTKKPSWTSRSASRSAYLAGWTAFPFEIAKHGNIFEGIGMGLWRTATNTVGGILHTATFPIPVDIPLPDGGVKFE